MNLAMRVSLMSQKDLFLEDRKKQDEYIESFFKKYKRVSRINCTCGHTFDLEYNEKVFECSECGDKIKFFTKIETIKSRELTEENIINSFMSSNIHYMIEHAMNRKKISFLEECNNRIDIYETKYKDLEYLCYVEGDLLVTELKYNIESELRYIFDLNTKYQDRHRIYFDKVKQPISKKSINAFVNRTDHYLTTLKDGKITKYYKGNGVKFSTLINRLLTMTTPMETLFKLGLVGKIKIPSFTNGGNKIKDLYTFLEIKKSSFKPICNYLNDPNCHMNTYTLKQIFERFDHNNAIKVCEFIKADKLLSGNCYNRYFCDLIEIGYSMKHTRDYIYRARESQGISPATALSYLKDYANMCVQMELKDFDRYPKSVKLYHDLAATRLEFFKDKLGSKKIEEIMDHYKDLENIKNDDYVIKIPRSSADLIQEGSNLGHCVGSYGRYISQGNSIIIFMRKTKDLDKSLLTIELDPKKELEIVQVSGQSNRAATPKEKTFIRTYLLPAIREFNNKNRKKIKVSA